MADRRSLLDTGKNIGTSVAGTFKSVAGTVAEKGKDTASRAKQGVKNQFEDLTDDTVTDQDQARLERARQEALQEARQEARQEFQEEFRENVADEAFDAEIQRLRRRTGINTMDEDESEPEPQATQTVERQAQPTFGGMGLFGPSPAQQRAQRPQQQTQTRTQTQPQSQQRRQAPQEQNPREAQFQNMMAFGGFAPPSQGQTQDPPPKVEQLFGVSSRGRDESEQVAPLFGLRY